MIWITLMQVFLGIAGVCFILSGLIQIYWFFSNLKGPK